MHPLLAAQLQRTFVAERAEQAYISQRHLRIRCHRAGTDAEFCRCPVAFQGSVADTDLSAHGQSIRIICQLQRASGNDHISLSGNQLRFQLTGRAQLLPHTDSSAQLNIRRCTCRNVQRLPNLQCPALGRLSKGVIPSALNLHSANNQAPLQRHHLPRI